MPTYKEIRISYNGVEVDTLVYQPNSKEMDALLVYHGTTMDDSKVHVAAETILSKVRSIIKRDDLMIVSVAYPEEGLLFGDNIKEAEAALLWVKNSASKALKVKVNRTFLLGHSQGGYLVTRLNTMHKTDGVVANGSGPIDLSFRCKLDERNKVEPRNGASQKKGTVCSLLKDEYGSVFDDPDPYKARSLINFYSGHKSKILFVQGLKDKKIQMTLWPKFKEKINQCTDCTDYTFLELEDSGHGAIFENKEAIEAVNEFLR